MVRGKMKGEHVPCVLVVEKDGWDVVQNLKSFWLKVAAPNLRLQAMTNSNTNCIQPRASQVWRT